MKKYGRGIATIMFGSGYGEGFPDHAFAAVEIKDDDKILIGTAAADVGEGVLTMVTQIASEVLKVKPEVVEVISGDTQLTKSAGSTSATRQTFFTGNAVKRASEELLGKIYHYASLEFISNHVELRIKDGYIFRKDNPNDKLSYWELAERIKERGDCLKAEASFFPQTDKPDSRTGQGEKVYVAYTFVTQVVEIEVDTDSGIVQVLKVYTTADIGKAINPRNVEGQIEGGTVQGIGMALMEEQVIKEGITLNPDLTGYLIPTSMDTPQFITRLIENEDSDGPYGAKGIGEPATIAISPAIANAIYDAIGVRISDLPITPEKILKALKQREIKKRGG
jgi:CO/xanthine dehydrogenase Mo-binding subunit